MDLVIAGNDECILESLPMKLGGFSLIELNICPATSLTRKSNVSLKVSYLNVGSSSKSYSIVDQI
jgi:hypothetical protein